MYSVSNRLLFCNKEPEGQLGFLFPEFGLQAAEVYSENPIIKLEVEDPPHTCHDKSMPAPYIHTYINK